MGEYEIDINDSRFLSITVYDGFASPNDHKEDDYFTLCVNIFELPWVLNEEFPKTPPLPIDTIAAKTSKIRTFFSQLFHR